MQNNVNVRMGMPGLANSQPRMVRPVLNLNYMPNNNNNPHGIGYRYAAPGISFRNRAPMYQPVYQHHTEDYQQPYMNEEFSNYFGVQNSMHDINSQTWTESDYFQYLNERAAHSQMISQNNYPPQFAQVDHTARFLQRTATTAPQVVRQPKVAASQKRNANTAFNAGSSSQQSQKNAKNGGFAKVPRRQNQPMALLPAPKPANHRTDKPAVQKKPHTIPLKQPQQKFQPETKGKQNQTQTNKMQLTQQSQVDVIKKEFAYKGKVERDRALVGTIPQLIKWRSARHKIPPVYGTVGVIDGRRNVVDEKLKIEDQFILSNLKQWNCNAESSAKELMECVVYTSEHRQPIFPVGQCVRVVGRFIPDSGLFQVLKIRLADESDLNYLSCMVNSLAFKPDKSLDRSLSAPSTFDASYEEPVNTNNDSYSDLQTTPAPVADTDYLFQPY